MKITNVIICDEVRREKPLVELESLDHLGPVGRLNRGLDAGVACHQVPLLQGLKAKRSAAIAVVSGASHRRSPRV